MISGTFWVWWYAGAAIWCLVALILWGIRDEMEKDFVECEVGSDNAIGWEIVWPIALVAVVIVATLIAVAYPFVCLGRYIGRRFCAT